MRGPVNSIHQFGMVLFEGLHLAFGFLDRVVADDTADDGTEDSVLTLRQDFRAFLHALLHAAQLSEGPPPLPGVSGLRRETPVLLEFFDAKQDFQLFDHRVSSASFPSVAPNAWNSSVPCCMKALIGLYFAIAASGIRI